MISFRVPMDSIVTDRQSGPWNRDGINAAELRITENSVNATYVRYSFFFLLQTELLAS